MLTSQEIFDRVAVHLAEQGVRSVGTDRSGCLCCRYRATVGTRVLSCAVGCLIPDDAFRPEFDLQTTTDINSLREYKPFQKALSAGGVDINQHLDLLINLQKIHDIMIRGYSAGTVTSLRRLAERFNLSPDAIRPPKEAARALGL